MGLIVMSAKELSKKLKVTVQKTGRLGFTQTTADELKLNESCSIKFYFDDKRKDSPVLQLLNCKDGDAFSVLKSGDYYYLSTAALFDKLGYDYKSQNIICDLVEDDEARNQLGDNNVYRLVPRKDKRKKRPVIERQPDNDSSDMEDRL